MKNSIAIFALIIGLICPFTQVARGQESDPVQPPPATMVEGPQGSSREGLPSRTWQRLTIRLLP